MKSKVYFNKATD